MSLNFLPDEIISKISKKMPQSDRLNLMKTSKRNARIGQKYRLQYKYGSNMTLGMCPQQQCDGNTILLGVRNDHMLIEKKEARFEDIGPMMKQFPSLKKLLLANMPINSDLVRDIEQYKGKIALIDISNNCCFDLTKTEFEKMTECCDKLRIENIEFASPNGQSDEKDKFTNKDLLSDQLIDEIIFKLYVFKPYFTPAVCRGKDLAADGSLLTDRLLLEIIPKNWPYLLNLCYCVTSFTLEGVLTFIKLAEPVRSKIAYFELGAFIVGNKTETLKKMKEIANQLNYALVWYDDVYNILDESFKHCKVSFCEQNKPVYNRKFIVTILHKL